MELKTGCDAPALSHCSARTRGGEPCRNPPIRWRQRCRMHGGAKGSGAPRGNRNVITHGCTTAVALAERRAIARLFRMSSRTLREVMAAEDQ
jgi:hypothetical protein